MQIEEGKYYRTRDGRMVGPMVRREKHWSDGTSQWWSNVGGAYLKGGMHYCKRENDLVAEWTDAPTLLRDMTDAEIGALVRRSVHDVEVFVSGQWCPKRHGGWRLDSAYRVKPEPVRETVRICAKDMPFRVKGFDFDITFDLIDGQPDPASIKMERVKARTA